MFVGSLHFPAVTTKDNGKLCPSTQRWILLVRPPRECPSHSSVTSPFFPRREASSGHLQHCAAPSRASHQALHHPNRHDRTHQQPPA